MKLSYRFPLQIIATLLLGFRFPTRAHSVDKKHDQLSFYEIGLACPAAPKIGCGSRAKPVLRELKEQLGIADVWLNNTGTILAVKWKVNQPRPPRSAAIKSVMDSNELQATELHGRRRDESLREFAASPNPKRWLRLEELDSLSKEEGGIVAARLVKRVNSKTQLSSEDKERLAKAIEKTFFQTVASSDGAQTNSKLRLDTELMKAGLDVLSSEKHNAWKEALESGYRPIAGEE